MAKFRYGLWAHYADLWLGGMSSWALSGGDGPRFIIGRPAGDDYNSLPATVSVHSTTELMLQALSQDDFLTGTPSQTLGSTPQSSGLTALEAGEPILWLMPRDESATAPLSPLGSGDGPDSSATASFIASSGDHIDFMSSQPGLGFGGGLFVNADTRTILTGAEAGREQIGSGPDDVLVLSGDNGHMSLAGYGAMFEQVALLGGADYDLSTVDGNVAAGHTLTVSAGPVGAGNHLLFDGSAETDGRFVLLGGAGGDTLTGGRGADLIDGGAGADTLTGGAGADRFLYASAADSTGAHHDTILDFTFGEDVIDLPVTVQGLDAAVTKGALSEASFDSDLAAALGGGVLEAGHALFFTPDSGGLAGHHFLVVDANGEAGYQAGADFVIELPSLPPADFHGTGFLV